MSVNKFGTALRNNNNNKNNSDEARMIMTRLLSSVDERFTQKIETAIASARLDAEYQRSQLETRVQRTMTDIVNAQLSRLEDDLNNAMERRLDHLNDRLEEFTTSATTPTAITTTDLYKRKVNGGLRRRR